jgi:predicted nucleic acid-binding protein
VEESREAMSIRFILDSSLALAWCFESESNDSTEEILDSFGEGTTAYVPALWAWEVNNMLTLAERAKRITAAKRLQKVAFLQSLPIELDEFAHRQCWGSTALLARDHILSVYDATYLEMGVRLNMPIGSLDKELRAAAQKEGVKVLPIKI